MTPTSHESQEGATSGPGAVTIRPATRADAPAIAAIYNEGIRGRGATFETAERTAADVLTWLPADGGSAQEFPDTPAHPFLVAVDQGGTVLGWVRASSYRPRIAYRGVAEFSVYVATDARGRRVGDALMSAFLPACAAAGLWKVLSRIFPENAASRALCARHGFREVGTYASHAQLDGVWRDVVIVERLFPENLT
jgi:phosphinothricin acetyltransferase